MGLITCKILGQAIDPKNIFEVTPDEKHGAQCVFFGAVRARNLNRDVVSVHYDVVAGLAENIFLEIAKESQIKWGNEISIQIIHRSGELSVGEISVAIKVSSPHRNEAFEACRYIIEEIKKRAPIWKKEIYKDGETQWLKGHALCQHTPFT